MFTLAGSCFESNSCGDDLYADVTGNATLGPQIADGYNRDELWATYINRPDVQTAIHALTPPFAPWSDCANIGYDITWPSNEPDYAALFAAGVRTLVFSGDVDMATCPFESTQFLVNTLNRTVTQQWTAWTVDTPVALGQVVGYVEEHNGFTFATVKAAGHEAVGYQPLAAYSLIEGFVTGKGLKTAAPRKAEVAAPAKRTQGSVLREAIERTRKQRLQKELEQQ